jgi:methyl-accepting chemotaxis protein
MNTHAHWVDRFIPSFGAGSSILAASGAVLAALVAAGILPARFSIATLAACAGSCMLGFASWIRTRRALGSLNAIAGADMAGEDGDINLASVLGIVADSDAADPVGELGPLFYGVNDDMAALQRSAKKFDLFSSDILFSAQNLAEQSSRQLSMLGTLRERTAGFFNTMTTTSGELTRLKETVHRNAASSNALRERALASRHDLTAIIERTRAAALDAKAGVEEVEITGSAALELERGLRSLNITAQRESEEAKSIAESILTIADIVERTHILATNASIEAARAGARGAGFAVIAQEIRKLSASSKAALEGIDRILRSVKSGIDESTSMVSSVSHSAAKLHTFLSRTRETFNGIGNSVLDIEKGIDRFDSIFSEQITGASDAASFAEKTAGTLEGFAEDYKNRSADYEAIVAATRESETYATDSKRSARLLAQLASYLKAGGAERNRILRRYKIESESSHRTFGRKERREDLLYNLEVFDVDDNPLGHLGNLSRSGLQLLSSRDIPAGSSLDLVIALPISSEGERRLNLKVTVRRSEKDLDGHRLGCSIDAGNGRQIEIVDEILRTLSLGGLAAPGADAADAAGIAGFADVPPPGIARSEDDADAEEVEEL